MDDTEKNQGIPPWKQGIQAITGNAEGEVTLKPYLMSLSKTHLNTIELALDSQGLDMNILLHPKLGKGEEIKAILQKVLAQMIGLERNKIVKSELNTKSLLDID